MLSLGESFPDVACETTTIGPIRSLHSEFARSSWVLFVCAGPDGVTLTELGELERTREDFEKRRVKIFVLACGGGEAWPADVHAATGYNLTFPLITDANLEKSVGAPRAYYFVGPDARVRLVWSFPATTGVSSFEILRCFDSLARAERKLATPVNWVPGRDVLLVPEVDSEEALPEWPQGIRTISLPSGSAALRLTPDPLDDDSDPPPRQ
ncbi:hypothetical protein CTAYLR_007399 [Chrysophaeum taylorii]|uniref:Peroxiredoxin C-terminal domain-containing protein n=1 Tax=Chrysophaeum taylorii TaxID=2483200 RepID=A0AAD7XG89_9STRA|nr:hypothetical protein CTAYLR_007399 [Chrysophaeum taylorii]